MSSTMAAWFGLSMENALEVIHHGMNCMGCRRRLAPVAVEHEDEGYGLALGVLLPSCEACGK